MDCFQDKEVNGSYWRHLAAGFSVQVLLATLSFSFYFAKKEPQKRLLVYGYI